MIYLYDALCLIDLLSFSNPQRVIEWVRPNSPLKLYKNKQLFVNEIIDELLEKNIKEVHGH